MRRNNLPRIIEKQSLSGARGPKAHERAMKIVQERTMKALCIDLEFLKEFILRIQLLPENEQQDEIGALVKIAITHYETDIGGLIGYIRYLYYRLNDGQRGYRYLERLYSGGCRENDHFSSKFDSYPELKAEYDFIDKYSSPRIQQNIKEWGENEKKQAVKAKLLQRQQIVDRIIDRTKITKVDTKILSPEDLQEWYFSVRSSFFMMCHYISCAKEIGDKAREDIQSRQDTYTDPRIGESECIQFEDQAISQFLLGGDTTNITSFGRELEEMLSKIDTGFIPDILSTIPEYSTIPEPNTFAKCVYNSDEEIRTQVTKVVSSFVKSPLLDGHSIGGLAYPFWIKDLRNMFPSFLREIFPKLSERYNVVLRNLENSYNLPYLIEYQKQLQAHYKIPENTTRDNIKIY